MAAVVVDMMKARGAGSGLIVSYVMFNNNSPFLSPARVSAYRSTSNGSHEGVSGMGDVSRVITGAHAFMAEAWQCAAQVCVWTA